MTKQELLANLSPLEWHDGYVNYPDAIKLSKKNISIEAETELCCFIIEISQIVNSDGIVKGYFPPITLKYFPPIKFNKLKGAIPPPPTILLFQTINEAKEFAQKHHGELMFKKYNIKLKD